MNKILLFLFFIAVGLVGLTARPAGADDGYDLWLKYKPIEDQDRLQAYRRAITSMVIPGASETLDILRQELSKAMPILLGRDVPIHDTLGHGSGLMIATPSQSPLIADWPGRDGLADLGREGFLIGTLQEDGRSHLLLSANEEIGLLYGAFHLLRMMQTERRLDDWKTRSKPRIQYRLLNHWDNLDGSVERGYAGKSLWQWADLPQTLAPRYRDYARANASLGINGTVVNNVNANPLILTPDYLIKLKALADVFRPYGIRLFVSIRFSSPLRPSANRNSRRGGIGTFDTADPLDPAVREWWKVKVEDIYELIPDFGGFLVKANSEGMPGPQDYQRSHAEGANMLAEALAPHGGIVMWRAFVYDADVDPDRAKRAYKEFVPLDGTFLPNAFVQAKNGPIDFQPREPAHPLFGAMPKTPLMLELQITQEYLGHAKHLVYLAPMWKECLQFDTNARGEGSLVAHVIDGELHDYAMTGIAGVTNIGSERNWCGHLFAQANWYAYGRLAWDHQLTSEAIAEEWIKATLSRRPHVVETVKAMMLGSREACVNYMTPLGLHHIMQAGFHYGPQPSYARSSRLDWTSVYYHRADDRGLGFDRSSSGSNATAQYFPPWRERFDSIETCPEEYLLWFHHVPWDHKMASGRILWDELCHRYDEGLRYVKAMRTQWQSIQTHIDSELHRHVTNKLSIHERDAIEWRNTCLTYFQGFSQRPIPE